VQSSQQTYEASVSEVFPYMNACAHGTKVPHACNHKVFPL